MRWYPSYPMASGRCCAPGYVPIAASPKRNCPPISASSSSFTTLVSAEKHSSAPSVSPSSPNSHHHPGSRKEPPVVLEPLQEATNLDTIVHAYIPTVTGHGLLLKIPRPTGREFS